MKDVNIEIHIDRLLSLLSLSLPLTIIPMHRNASDPRNIRMLVDSMRERGGNRSRKCLRGNLLLMGTRRVGDGRMGMVVNRYRCRKIV